MDDARVETNFYSMSAGANQGVTQSAFAQAIKKPTPNVYARVQKTSWYLKCVCPKEKTIKPYTLL